MKKQRGEAQSGGIGVLGLLGVVFVTLKLCGVIDWSWWWVTAPFWGVLAIIAAVFALLAIPALLDSIRRYK